MNDVGAMLPSPTAIRVALIQALNVLYFVHTLLHIFLGLIKLVRGRYQHEKPGTATAGIACRNEMYVRHHGSSILALATLSGLVSYLACRLRVNLFFSHVIHVNSLTFSRESPPNFERLVLGCIDVDFCE